MSGQSVRVIEYLVTASDSGRTVKEVMSGRLGFSVKEITRCKQFDDGIMVMRADSGESGSKTESEGGNESEGGSGIGSGSEGGNGSSLFLPVMVKAHLHEGDLLRIKIYEANENAGEVIPSDADIDIVYEDEDVILLNKPGDLVVHPSYAHHTDSLSNALAGYYERTGQNHVIRTIGRLDRETSGLILFAKNRYSAAILSNQKESMSRRKEYLALAWGQFTEKEGTIDAPIGETDTRMIRRVSEDGKRAVTHYRVVEQHSDYALLRLFLETGRTHQIRVHMQHIGHPLLGDSLYGKDIPDSHGLKRAALHAAHLEFAQPVTGRLLSFDSELPDEMRL